MRCTTQSTITDRIFSIREDRTAIERAGIMHRCDVLGLSLKHGLRNQQLCAVPVHGADGLVNVTVGCATSSLPPGAVMSRFTAVASWPASAATLGSVSPTARFEGRYGGTSGN